MSTRPPKPARLPPQIPPAPQTQQPIAKAPPPPAPATRRLARDGFSYSWAEFQEYYGHVAALEWANAPEAVDSSASQPAHLVAGNASYSTSQPQANPNDGAVAQRANILVRRIATSACSSGPQLGPAQNVIYLPFWKWITEHMESRGIPAGSKALTIRKFVLPLATLNRSFHEFVTEFVDDNELATDYMTLLRLVVMDPCMRSVEFHNRSLLRSQHCVDIVLCLMRFRRTDWFPRTRSKHSATRKPLAFSSYYPSGHLREVSKAMVELNHSRWKQLWERYCLLTDNSKSVPNITPLVPSKKLAILYWNHTLTDNPSWLSARNSFIWLNRRRASVPLITDGSNRCGQTRRSKSLQRENYYLDY